MIYDIKRIWLKYGKENINNDVCIIFLINKIKSKNTMDTWAVAVTVLILVLALAVAVDQQPPSVIASPEMVFLRSTIVKTDQ